MKPVATVVAIMVLVLTGLPLWGPFTGTADAAPDRVVPTEVPPGVPTEIPDPDAGPLTLRLAQLEPRVVTSEGPNTLTVTGSLVNTGEVPVGNLEIRVQRGLPLGTEGALRDALDGSAGTDAVTPQFVPLPGELAPGDQVPVRLALLLRGPPETSLALSSTGVHELLVNVNGVPGDGPRARLAAVRMLLPVVSLPPDPTAPDPRSSREPAAPQASPFALLYPIADRPRRLSTVPGEPALLTDDDLATSLAPDGRLGGLVAALGTAPVGSPARNATCLAVDPDLVETAVAMRDGYQVLGPGGVPVPGTGAEVARQWVDGLASTARGGCVIALPYADADLVALTRGGLGDLARLSITEGRRILAALLGTPVEPGVTWPADGVADEATLDAIAQADGRAVVLSAGGVEQGRTQRRAGVVPIAGARLPQFAVLTDPLLGLAAAGPSPLPAVGNGRGALVASTPAGVSTPLSTQDAIGALAFRARSGPDSSGAPVVLAPPHQWAAEGTGATALLRAVAVLLDAGLITPRPLDDVLAADPPAAQAEPVAYPLRASGREIPGPVIDSIRTTAAQLADLRSAGVADSAIGLDPDEVLGPVRLGLVRPASAGLRGRPEAAVDAAAAAADRIADLRSAVRVVEPPSPYSLGTSDAPILVTIGNGLPFTVRVRLEIASTSGLRVAPIEMQEVPPQGRRQARVSAQVTRSGQFTVQASVRSPDGQLLGPPSRLRVRSTAYGTITVWLTASAGVLLVVLAVRRVLRRVRGEPVRRSRPARGRPHPLPPDRSPPDRSPPVNSLPTPGELRRPDSLDRVPGPPARPTNGEQPAEAHTERMLPVPPRTDPVPSQPAVPLHRPTPSRRVPGPGPGATAPPPPTR